MDREERQAIIQLVAQYHETLGRIETAGQLEAVLRLGGELAAALPAEQAALFGRLVGARGTGHRIPGPYIPEPRTRRSES
jgi:hypothetical protein